MHFCLDIHTRRHLVILDGSTCLVKFEDPKVLIASVGSTSIVVFVGEKISEFYHADLENSDPQDRLGLTMIYKKSRDLIKN